MKPQFYSSASLALVAALATYQSWDTPPHRGETEDAASARLVPHVRPIPAESLAAQPMPPSAYGERFAKASAQERECLARVIYFEARSEPRDVQIGVAQVVLNRAASGLWPASICGVVRQGSKRGGACQMPLSCLPDGAPVAGRNWDRSMAIADDVLSGRLWLPEFATADHFHRLDQKPAWRIKLKPVTKIGQHVFYASAVMAERSLAQAAPVSPTRTERAQGSAAVGVE